MHIHGRLRSLGARVLGGAFDAPSLAGTLGDRAVAPHLVGHRGDRPPALAPVGPALYDGPPRPFPA